MKIFIFIFIILYSITTNAIEKVYQCKVTTICEKSEVMIDDNEDFQSFCLPWPMSTHGVYPGSIRTFTIDDDGTINIESSWLRLNMPKPKKDHAEYFIKHKDYEISFMLGDFYQFEITKLYKSSSGGHLYRQIHNEEGYCK